MVRFFTEVEPNSDDIEDIDLSDNYIGNRGILALLDVVEHLPNFRYLNLANQKPYNTDLSDDSVKGNSMVDRVVEVLKAHPTANALDISNNPVSNYAGRKLLGLVQVNPRICRVELTNTRVDFDLRKRIASQCERNTQALWEHQGHVAGEHAFGGGEANGNGAPSESAGFGVISGWTPASTRADLTALGGGKHRRTTVRSEGVDPEKAKNFVAPVFEKSEDELNLIVELLQHNVLFSFMVNKDLRRVALAMRRRDFRLGDEVMTQGSVNDTLYIVQSGQADILKEGQKVFLKTEGSAVGEIELMYDTACVATVSVVSDQLVTWYLDRGTYRNLVMGTAINRRETFMRHLNNVPFLSTLDSYEKLQVADALSLDEWKEGDVIIPFDTDGEWMYIILEGSVEVYGRDEAGNRKYVCDFQAGHYVGELEFLNNHRTVADVIAKSYVQTAKLNRRHFEMCMGPVLDVLKRNTMHPKYEYYQHILEERRHGSTPTPGVHGHADE